MNSLLQHVPARAIALTEALPFVLAIVIAQLFFKWGSFALELFGFLGLWYLLGLVMSAIVQLFEK